MDFLKRLQRQVKIVYEVVKEAAKKPFERVKKKRYTQQGSTQTPTTTQTPKTTQTPTLNKYGTPAVPDNVSEFIARMLELCNNVTDIEPWYNRGSIEKIMKANEDRRKLLSTIANIVNNMKYDKGFQQNVLANHKAIMIELERMLIDSDDNIITDSYDMIIQMLTQNVDIDVTDYEYEL